MKRRSALALALGIALTTACGSDGGASDDGGTSRGGTSSEVVLEADESATANDAVRAVCARSPGCEGTTYALLSEAECLAYLSQPCQYFASLTSEDGLAVCAAAIEAASCDDSPGEVARACGNAYTRSRARRAGLPAPRGEGQSCGDGVECLAPHVCDFANGTCGRCVSARIGEACVGGRCGEGSCGDDGRCAAWELELERVPVGGACETHDDCVLGSCEGGTCVVVARCEPGSEGERCGYGGCQDGLACHDGHCERTDTPLTDGRVEGQGCADDGQCASGHCIDYRCTGTGSCLF